MQKSTRGAHCPKESTEKNNNLTNLRYIHGTRCMFTTITGHISWLEDRADDFLLEGFIGFEQRMTGVRMAVQVAMDVRRTCEH
ncbi:hypothetical protein CTI12_AA094030 [Artemisia annua]|uniref:Uncharacterized protein n=1 Tax=Artemisia annua TaxID=35608 RepID=A0A2U1PZD1_ARTAN|nr:hypothetical protein CTI12_AA094030 [Artemisia annua]